MNKIFNLTSTFKAAEADDGSVMIRGMASTADFDRAGDTISAEAWTKGGLQNFEKNPIILFNHDYDRPIGRATGMKAGPNGLELECKISKNAPGNVAELVKDGVLGAFSVGFKVKDADYIKETDGLMIKDAELFEVSVVSVPCNQSATFSLAKSFDSTNEYEEFKKTFTNRVDLAGQSLAKDEDISSNIASDHTPKSAETNSADQEIKMDNQNIDLEAFAKKVAEDTAAKIAMKQAEQKAADEAVAKAAQEAEAAKAAEGVQIKSTIESGIQTGVEALQADMEKAFNEAKEGELQEVTKKFEAQVAEKTAELEAMRNSKRDFSGRQKGDTSAWGNDFLQAKVLGAITGKGYGTDFARDVAEKAGVDITYTADGIDQSVETSFTEAVRLEQRVAGLFRELAVGSSATVLPVAPDTALATFGANGITDTDNTLTNSIGSGAEGAYETSQVILRAYRLIAGTFLSNDTDEATLVAMLPMISSALARSHARAMDSMCLVGAGSTSVSKGLVGVNGVDTITGAYGAAPTGDIDTSTASSGVQTAIDASSAQEITANGLLAMRQDMGKFGMNASDVAYILPVDGYLQLIDGPGFTDITEVGSDLASKVTGMIGTIYGSPVIASDILASNLNSAGTPATTAACAVNVNNYLIPRLKGVGIESEYSVAQQRTALVASQSVGFNQIEAGSAGNAPVVRASYA